MKKIFLAIAMLISVAGYSQIQSASLTASGLTCSMCSKAIYKALIKLPSVQKVDANIETSSYIITFKKDASVSPETLKSAVEDAGFAIAKLDLVAVIPKTTIAADTKVTLQGSTYRFIGATGKTVQGTQTLTVVDKSYLPVAEWKRYAKNVSAVRESRVYFVTL
jgi:copper chaperone CopZ